MSQTSQNLEKINEIKETIEELVKKDEARLTELEAKIQKGSFASEEESEKIHDEFNFTLSRYKPNKQTYILLAGAEHQQLIVQSDEERRELLTAPPVESEEVEEESDTSVTE